MYPCIPPTTFPYEYQIDIDYKKITIFPASYGYTILNKLLFWFQLAKDDCVFFALKCYGSANVHSICIQRFFPYVNLAIGLFCIYTISEFIQQPERLVVPLKLWAVLECKLYILCIYWVFEMVQKGSSYCLALFLLQNLYAALSDLYTVHTAHHIMGTTHVLRENLSQWKVRDSSNHIDWHLRFPKQIQKKNMVIFCFFFPTQTSG